MRKRTKARLGIPPIGIRPNYYTDGYTNIDWATPIGNELVNEGMYPSGPQIESDDGAIYAGNSNRNAQLAEWLVTANKPKWVNEVDSYYPEWQTNGNRVSDYITQMSQQIAAPTREAFGDDQYLENRTAVKDYLVNLYKTQKGNPEFFNEDGSLTQKGLAGAAQSNYYGPRTSHYAKGMQDSFNKTVMALNAAYAFPYLLSAPVAFGGSLAGGYAGDKAGNYIAKKAGGNETTQRIAGLVGSLAGGIGGGLASGSMEAGVVHPHQEVPVPYIPRSTRMNIYDRFKANLPNESIIPEKNIQTYKDYVNAMPPARQIGTSPAKVHQAAQKMVGGKWYKPKINPNKTPIGKLDNWYQAKENETTTGIVSTLDAGQSIKNPKSFPNEDLIKAHNDLTKLQNSDVGKTVESEYVPKQKLTWREAIRGEKEQTKVNKKVEGKNGKTEVEDRRTPIQKVKDSIMEELERRKRNEENKYNRTLKENERLDKEYTTRNNLEKAVEARKEYRRNENNRLSGLEDDIESWDAWHENYEAQIKAKAATNKARAKKAAETRRRNENARLSRIEEDYDNFDWETGELFYKYGGRVPFGMRRRLDNYFKYSY